MKISLVIPVFNEQKTIAKTIKKAIAYLNLNFKDYEIIVVNDGSTDQTSNILSSFNSLIKTINIHKNTGKGNAVRNGALFATGDYVFFTDADLPYHLSNIKTFLPSLVEYDIAIGCRSKCRKGYCGFRKTLSNGYSLLTRGILKSDIKDTQCGFKGFKSQCIKKIFPLSVINGFAFDFEILYLASKYGCSIKKHEINMENNGESKVNFITDPFLMASDILRVKMNDFSGKYDCL